MIFTIHVNNRLWSFTKADTMNLLFVDQFQSLVQGYHI